MIFSALKGFEILGEKQIKEKIKEHLREPPEHKNNCRTRLERNSAVIVEQDNFTLILDQESLDFHRCLRISNCSHFTIRSFLSSIKPPNGQKFFIEIIDCENFLIEGIFCDGGRNMLCITGSSYFTIKNCTCSNAEGSGIIINNGNNFKVSECFFKNNLSAAILVLGNSFNGNIRDCTCTLSRGYFNHDAAIHLCCTSKHVTASQIPEHCHESLPISEKDRRPHHILIKNCSVTQSRAQGIYLEGVVNCVIEDNLLIQNNKEGICFDWGSCYNFFKNNVVSLNGERCKLSVDEIRADFITEYPLLDDGSSSMKLPGISLDNGCMNIIHNNKITSNYGGGIKMIRTSLFNDIRNNQILYNAIGANNYSIYFHGITMLGLGAINNEFDPTSQHLLDFLPSICNCIEDNVIVEHWQPIFFDKISANNFISGNVTPNHEVFFYRFKTKYVRFKRLIMRFISKLPMIRVK
ncbi:MAG: right-handed parallel beta-helix repeat-containing protein [Bacteroidetes bacterium]|nr:right-handed parallel beta-helix repeat-containing protein [Bacteroidota bacterium]